ncbi:hypothetical protein [Actinomadura flavalba]|uniref:hypothetical protein n=1 Tax=Actinomadura flavalba TaxID=1120938 RepID=UPI0003669ADF|nr:hypothetical protein [Actinomadura flavalba]
MTEIAVPRWADWAAHAVPLVVLPSGLWRIALGLGVPMGMSGSMAATYEAPSWTLTPYVFALTLVGEFFAFLTLGLVRPWGEVFPAWMPWIGGWRVPVTAAVGAALTGAALVILISVQFGTGWNELFGSPEAPQGFAKALMIACYAPFVLWGPLLLAVTAHYAWRRSSAGLAPSQASSRSHSA